VINDEVGVNIGRTDPGLDVESDHGFGGGFGLCGGHFDEFGDGI
jgi:hypothetical protein